MHRLVLADDALVQLLLQVQQLLHLALQQLGHGDAGPAADDLGDVLLVHLLLDEPVCALLLRQALLLRLELAFEGGQLAVLQLGGPVQIVLPLGLLDARSWSARSARAGRASCCTASFSVCQWALSASPSALQVGQLLFELGQPLLGGGVRLLPQRLALDLQLHDAPGDLVQLGRHRVDLGAQLGRRLVHQVDGLVRQEAVGDVAIGQHGRRDQGRVLDAHAVVHLVALLQAAQDRDRVLDRRLIDQHRLEAPFQGRVLLDVLAVLVERGRADAVQLAAGQHRLEQVAGVHGALGLAGADDGVQLVDEQDDLALRLPALP